MSTDNRKRTIARRFPAEVEGLVQAYAAKHGVTALDAACLLIRRPGDSETAAAARVQVDKWNRGEIERLTAERDIAARALATTRADLESAREATRRADAEIERITADWRAALAETERVKALALERAGTDATEIKRLTRELTISEENTAAAVRLVNRRESELAEVRAALETKGATDRLAERVETIASEVYAGFSDDFEAKLTERAPGWKGTLPELRARVITLGFSRYDALATDAAKRAVERGR